jgi:hypothetical protein
VTDTNHRDTGVTDPDDGKSSLERQPLEYRIRQSDSDRRKVAAERRRLRREKLKRRRADQRARLRRRVADQRARLRLRLADQGEKGDLPGVAPYCAAAIVIGAIAAFVFMWPYGDWLDRQTATRFMTLNGHHAWAMAMTVAAVVIVLCLALPTNGFKEATPREYAALWLAYGLTVASAFGFVVAATIVALLLWGLFR